MASAIRSLKRIALLIAISISAVSCVFDSGSKRIDGPYILIWIDTGDQTSINYELSNSSSVGRVMPQVIAYGVNSDYVTAHRKDIGFYYIDRSKDGPYAETENVVFGPYTEDEFRDMQQKLGLPGLRKVPKFF